MQAGAYFHACPCLWIPVKASPHGICKLDISERRKADPVVNISDCVHFLDKWEWSKGSDTMCHLVKDATKGPYVGGSPNSHGRCSTDIIRSS